MTGRSTSMLVAVSLSVLALTGCGGGGATDAVDDDVPLPQPAPQPQPQPQPGDPALDQQLAPLLANANAAPLPAPPPENAALVELGRALFFDKELSGNRNISCSTCHDTVAGTSDGLSVSIGEGGGGRAEDRQLAGGSLIPRNAPALWNLGGPNTNRMFWDSRVTRNNDGNLNTPEPALNGPNPAAGAVAQQLGSALAAQAMFPPTSATEMRGTPGENEIADAADNLEIWARLTDRLVGTNNGTVGGIAGYQTMFSTAYPGVNDVDDFNFGHAANALAAFQRSAFQATDSPYDRYLRGDTTAMTDDQKRGAILFFGQAGCARCHGGPRLSNNNHHALAIPQVGPGRDFPFEDTGRAAITGNTNDLYEFRTPQLRNVAMTGPWFHDGAYTTLDAVVRHYDNPVANLFNYDPTQLTLLMQPTVDLNGGRNQARADALANQLRRPNPLSDLDVQRLVAFLNALTDIGSLDLASEVPASVPSGLPVGD